ncbi:MAG: 30S ribosomal protein S12 methylthiotransferase RimO [Chloroflexi bacterium]|nr:30S ribosomal protein S12 methylthiotransferase RimO [Chloroflexota bacterium]MDA1240978.1 30S ribosomal protein S12 methylthiotransferase RimO [Chloroflexota bacterium]
MKYHLVTLGCAKNTVDSMRLEAALRGGRHLAVDAPEQADLLLVNTCGFIDAAKDESIGVVRELDANRRPGQQIVVVGCLTQIAEDEVRRAVPGIDATFGAEQWDAIAASVGAASETYDIPISTLPVLGQPSAYLKISDGCDRPCTFCIIPTIKGRMHSGPARNLIAEARMYAAAGAKELVLVAQDSTAYGEDEGDRDGLAVLLEELSEAVPEVPWIRLMYAYPGKVTPRLAESMATLPNVVPYLDMPLQHGSDSVLRRMKRPTLAKARRSIEIMRAAVPDVVLRTTFIVGFPGETEAEFRQLLRFMEEQEFDRVGAFTYSPQPGTPAAEMPGQVAEAVKQERYGRVMELAQQISLASNRSMTGREVDVLIESREPATSASGDPVSVGRTYRDAPEVDGMAFVKGVHAMGSIVRARVDGALPYDLLCSPVDAPVRA